MKNPRSMILLLLSISYPNGHIMPLPAKAKCVSYGVQTAADCRGGQLSHNRYVSRRVRNASRGIMSDAAPFGGVLDLKSAGVSIKLYVRAIVFQLFRGRATRTGG